uniref:Kinesin motor domain-containing protein n=1 Tax=Brugia timori TaxID=42155 RepID=A0A0R3R9M9_9BILA
LHKQGAFDMDSNAIYRYYIPAIVRSIATGDRSSCSDYRGLDCHENSKVTIVDLLRIIVGDRVRKNEIRTRRYDILSAKQLVPEHNGSEDSDDDLFVPVRSDSIRHLIPANILQ